MKRYPHYYEKIVKHGCAFDTKHIICKDEQKHCTPKEQDHCMRLELEKVIERDYNIPYREKKRLENEKRINRNNEES